MKSGNKFYKSKNLFGGKNTKGCNHKGKNNPGWKNGRIKNYHGYIFIWKPDHPNCNSRGYVLEHRLVAEQMLGRYLLPSEIPHHINGKRDDNRPENIKVLANREEHNKIHKAKDVILMS